MSQAPSIYTRQRDFTDGATNNPEQQVADIATGLDAEFVAVANSLNTTINRLSELQKDDGALRDAIVSAQNLDTSLRALIALQGTTIRGAWATGTAYAIGDVVSNGGGTYLCVTAHQASGVFETDSTAGKWITLEAPYNNSVTTTRYTANGTQVSYSLGVNGIVNVTSVFIDGVYQNKNTYDISGSTLTFSSAPPSGSIIEMIVGAITPVSVSIPDLFISTSMLQTGSVTTAKIADGAVTPAKLSTGAPTWDGSGALNQSGGQNPAITVQPNALNGQSSVNVVGTGATSGITKLLQMYCNQSGGGFYSNDSIPIYFTNAATQRMVIDASGNVGIGTGTNTLNNKLEVNGLVKAGNAYLGDNATVGVYTDSTNIAVRSPGSGGIYLQSSSGTATYALFSSAGVNMQGLPILNCKTTAKAYGQVSATGTITGGYNTSGNASVATNVFTITIAADILSANSVIVVTPTGSSNAATARVSAITPGAAGATGSFTVTTALAATTALLTAGTSNVAVPFHFVVFNS